MSKVNGGCLCGSVRYTSEEEPVMTAICHCKHCQKQTGSAFSIVVGVPQTSLSLSGSTLVEFEDVGDSGQPVHRFFCNKCGSPIYTHVDVMGDIAFVKAGTLDDASWLVPQMHIWCCHAQPWVPIDESLPNAERNPEA